MNIFGAAASCYPKHLLSSFGAIGRARREDLVGFRQILVAVDDSPIAAHALDVALDLAASSGASLALVHVVDVRLVAGGDGLPASEVLADLRRLGEALIRKEIQRIPTTQQQKSVVREGKPAAEIVAAATEWGADLVVVGTHGRSGISRALLGSTAEGVLRHSPCPVLMVNEKSASH